MYDILIQNGHIIDGTGSPAMKAQVAIQDGKIVKIARKIEGEAKTVIDATGKVITPGFTYFASYFITAPPHNGAGRCVYLLAYFRKAIQNCHHSARQSR